MHGVLRHAEVTRYCKPKTQIRDKQAAPLGRTLCNFTQVARNVEPIMILHDHSNCPCRNNAVIHQISELVDQHVVTADPRVMIDPEIRKLFTFGSKFRHNMYMSIESIIESLRIGLQDNVTNRMKRNPHCRMKFF